MRRSLLPPILVSLCFLTACEPGVEDYAKNVKLRESKLRECGEMGVMAAKDDEHCQMAMEAQGIVIKREAGELLDAMTLRQFGSKDEQREDDEDR